MGAEVGCVLTDLTLATGMGAGADRTTVTRTQRVGMGAEVDGEGAGSERIILEWAGSGLIDTGSIETDMSKMYFAFFPPCFTVFVLAVFEGFEVCELSPSREVNENNSHSRCHHAALTHQKDQK